MGDAKQRHSHCLRFLIGMRSPLRQLAHESFNGRRYIFIMASPVDFLDCEYVQNLISNKAFQLSRRPGFSSTDREDLKQDLLAHLFYRMHHYDPARAALHIFAKTIVERHAASIARRRDAQKRDPRRTCSLHRTYETTGAESKECGANLPEELRARHAGGSRRPAAATTELRLAITLAIGELPELDQIICRRLLESSQAQIRRDLGISASKLQTSLRRIRACFERHDLKSFLGISFLDAPSRRRSSVQEDNVNLNYGRIMQRFGRASRR